MQEIINGVQISFVSAGGSVGLSALFMTGLIVLWYSKFDKKSEVIGLFWYALIMLIFVINPVYIYLVEKKVPILKNDNLYLWLIPTAPVILYAGVNIIASLREQTKSVVKKAAFIIGIIGVLFLAIISSYDGFDISLTNGISYFTDEENEVFDIAEEYREKRDKKFITIIGPEKIVEDARKYSGYYETLYGKELWQGAFENEINHTYESWQYKLYENMKTPSERACYEEIAALASVNGVDVIVLSIADFNNNDVEIPEALLDRYYLNFSNEKYLVYLKNAYEEKD